MNKTSLSPSRLPIRCICFFVACVLGSFTSLPAARADGAPPPEPDMGGVAPYHPIKTNVQMMAETVLIDVLPHPARWTGINPYLDTNRVKVKASFTLRNQGTAEEKMQVIFPLSRLDTPWVTSSYNIIGSSFVALVNGKPVPTTPVYTPPELQPPPESSTITPPDGFFVPDVSWAGFEVAFPVHQDVLVEVQYDMWGYSETGLHQVDYILETGAGWYGRILTADIIVQLPYPATAEAVPGVPPGCVLSGKEVQCKRTNFEPKRKDNLTFGFLDTNKWTPALELRARVEKYPDDADAWYELGMRYGGLGFWWEDVIVDQHLADLAVDAFERAVALRPDWGDAHCQLARVLWFNNPKLIRGYGGGAIQKNITAEDPVVQRALQESKAAASYGISEGNYCYLAEEVNAIAGLGSPLPTPVVIHPTPTAPTATPAPIPASIQKVIGIAVGNYHTCVLTAGEVKCGGDPGLRVAGDFKAAVAGDSYTCMLTKNGDVKCMGRNTFGQLGDGTRLSREVPVDVKGLTGGVTALVAGDNHTCALMTSGGVKCWGRNYFGELGDSTRAYSLVPVDVRGLDSGVAKLAAGSDHTCAFMRAGGIKCWGANESGQLGDGSLEDRLEPVDITGLPNDITALTAGLAHTCALNSQGQVMCWGDNSHHQLGDGNPAVHTMPVIVPGLDRDIVNIAAGNGYTCALRAQGGVKCWGREEHPDESQPGGGKEIDQPVPVDVPGLTSGAVDIAAGNDHACALLQIGRVRCWGWTYYGYNGVETDYGIQYASTSASSLPVPKYTPMPVLTAIPSETAAPAMDIDLVWDLIFLIAISALLLIWRRLKSGHRDEGEKV